MHDDHIARYSNTSSSWLIVCCNFEDIQHKLNTLNQMQGMAFGEAEKDLFQRHQRVMAGAPRWTPEGGTTALVVVMQGGQLYLANVGDCRAVLGR